MNLEFSKMHGVGNDFVVINNLHQNYTLTPRQLQQIADRHFGVGCDQILLVEAATDGISDYYYRIYNADGSEAEMCGNGARCFIQYLKRHGITTKQQLQLQTTKRIIQGEILSDGQIKIEMGIAEFDPHQIPLQLALADSYTVDIHGEEITFAALSIGNPHAVVKLETIEKLHHDVALERTAKLLQSSPIFPRGVNVNFIVIDGGKLHLRTYERGCGFTLGCGSGACASAVIAIRDNLLPNPVQVLMLGGQLQVQIVHGKITMTGDANEVFSGIMQLCSD